ncbi:hypothetical protein [Wenzhouxiangella sediminis]|uniref:Uncharacterized protein n=1 Tax=Wenzhouxiangella sediminis TaxID=1792836 RepID=A0A3E1KAC5_9GAMM|nr:hypothetical protein [Wenzhouxiangella sediminis]RFF31222.1 hypothetical protein DZC52_05235 [Wenzhouxiangella sediminis]
MSNDSFSFSMPLSAGTSSGTDAPRYLAPPFDARMADSGQALLLIQGDAAIRRVPVQLVQVFGQCNRFRSLEEHSREIARALRVPPQQTGAVRQALEELVRRQLLLTEEEALQRLQASANASAGPANDSISCLFIRTCQRPETLDRLLASLARRPLPDGLERVVVLDDDADPEGRRATRAVVESHRDGFPCALTLVDQTRRQGILDRIAREAGAEPARLRWCIEGDPESPETSYGASLNFALLLGAGKLIALIDDDATLDAFELPGSDERPAFRRQQSARLQFPEPDEDLPGERFNAVDGHPLALHAHLLGAGTRRLGELAGDDIAGLLDDLDPQLLSELSGASRIRLTSSGTLGDPGTAGLQWLFDERPEHLEPLCESEDRYRRLIEQRRVARATARPEVTTAYALMTTTLTGIDNRDLLLPTQPRGANEDLLFGALVDFLHPGSLQANLPHMLFHMRPEPRRWQASDVDEPRGVNRGAFLTAKVESLRSRLPQGDTRSRVNLLAGALKGLAQAGRDEIAWQLRQELLEVRSQMIERVTSVREALEPPPWLDRDFARVIERHGQVEEAQDRRLVEIAEQLPGFLRHYTDALPDWTAGWEHCRKTGIDNLLEGGS